jgi:uncharacterized protein (DUF983 family)
MRAIMGLRCPRCRVGKVYRGMVTMHRTCPDCGLKFEREPGYFLGAMYFSYALAVILIGILMFLGALLFPAFSYLTIFIIASVAFLPFVPLIFRYSRVVWMHFDRMIDPDPVNPSVIPPGSSPDTVHNLPRRNGHTRHTK